MNTEENDGTVIETMTKILRENISTIDLDSYDGLRKFIVSVVDDFYGQYSLNEYSRILNIWKRDTRLIKAKKIVGKKNSPFWSGSFVCIEKMCCKSYQLKIDKEPIENQQFKIEIRVNEDEKAISHQSKVKSSKKFYGEERKELALQIMSTGTVNVQSSLYEKNNKEFNEKYKNVNLAVLRQIKSEFNSSYKLSNDLIVDTLANKNLIDKLDLNGESSSKLKGFIRNISIDPHEFLIFNQLNVNLWKNYCQNYPEYLVCYFDATGSIIENIKDQKRKFYYSLIVNEKKQHLSYPIAEFLTTDNTSLNIANYSFHVKQQFKN
ncbi:unnamed protein product [Brachionus calyciflorus]|uniref:Uncharacterized protein n=1 Tax=Brachionus calyciflorus TaxID=104777 RepID=A0A814CP32_9BILA|nr:unnamed protein product [Brachionus calyciflorus]